ncbi:MAG TPA: class I SAM-dependent methyltransferase [Terriglobales bacterium]|nr:class I SAM-dependent methyltransferase [Terriglobales bacterium]
MATTPEKLPNRKTPASIYRWYLAAGLCGSMLAVTFALHPARLVASSATPAPQSTAATQAHPRNTSRPYTGDLSIFDSPGRDERLQINRVMDMLGISTGKNVADIGAGSGWFTVRAAKRVTDTGTVYAVDINPQATKYISERAQREQLHNVKTILSKPDDPSLPPDSVDAVLLLKTYHEVAHPVVLLKQLRASLKPDAKLGIIDRNGSADNHGIDKDVVIKEAQEAGYRLVTQSDLVKGDGMDYFMIFEQQP